MKKIKKHIEIVSSDNKSLSSMSEKSYKMISDILAKHYEKVGITLVENEDDLQELLNKGPDLVFLGVKRVPRKPTADNASPCVWVSEFLDNEGIYYTGSSAEAIKLDEDKDKAKKVIAKAELKTANHFMAYSGQHINESQLPLKFPMFIKPPNLGAGMGISNDSLVNNFKGNSKKVTPKL